MKRAGLSAVVLVLGCALASCMPRLTPNPPAPDPYGAALTVTAGPDFQTVRFAAGTRAAVPTVTLYAQAGRAVAVNSAACKAAGADVVCALASVAAGGAYNIPARNVARASAAVLRPDGLTYTLNSP